MKNTIITTLIISIFVLILAIITYNIPSDKPIENKVIENVEPQASLIDQKELQDRIDEIKINEIEKFKSKKETIPTEEIYDEILYQSLIFDIDPDLMISLFIQESNFYTKAVSSANCRGLGQISKMVLDDFNAKYLWEREQRTYTFDDMFDYKKNIRVSCWYLRFLYDNHSLLGFEKQDFLIAYNTGARLVEKYKNRQDYNYDKNIRNYYILFKNIIS